MEWVAGVGDASGASIPWRLRTEVQNAYSRAQGNGKPRVVRVPVAPLNLCVHLVSTQRPLLDVQNTEDVLSVRYNSDLRPLRAPVNRTRMELRTHPVPVPSPATQM